MQFDTAVIWAGETAATQGAGFHAKVATVFLNHDVGGDLGGAEQAMLALIDRKVFRDAVGKGGVSVIPAGGEFFESDAIWAISINLVGAHVDEHGLWSMATGGFEEIEGADGVGVEIIKGTRGSEVVARLGGSVDDMGGLERSEAVEHTLSVSDIELVMLKGRVFGFESLLIPTGVTLRAEKVCPHVVVNAVNDPTQRRKVVNDFRADEA